MKTLYIHGFGGSVPEEKLNILKAQGLEVYALHLKYDHQSYFLLKDYILGNNLEYLVGSSHGGFMAYWLAEELALPCLLLNPHLSLSARKKVSPTVSQLSCPICTVALGGEDQLVDPNRSLQYLEAEQRPDKVVKIKWVERQGHSFDLEVLQEIVAWSLEEIKIFYKEKG
ncbi:MAG: hypothetical protein HC913_01810 [Microscillaceae bacterium]|nr:hypothetical protein [Microscillaceae bacterium]